MNELAPTPPFEVSMPELDVEASLICAALWSKDAETVQEVATAIPPEHFERPAHQLLWRTWQAQAQAQRPHDPASVLAQLTDAGRTPAVDTAITALRGITTLGSEPTALPWHALDVATAAYRRAFARMADRLTQAAETEATSDLFPLLVEHGIEQRAAANQLADLRSRLGLDAGPIKET